MGDYVCDIHSVTHTIIFAYAFSACYGTRMHAVVRQLHFHVHICALIHLHIDFAVLVAWMWVIINEHVA